MSGEAKNSLLPHPVLSFYQKAQGAFPDHGEEVGVPGRRNSYPMATWKTPFLTSPGAEQGGSGIRGMFGCLVALGTSPVQKQIPIFTFLTKYVGAVLAEWKVKKGEREEVACARLVQPTSFHSKRLLALEKDTAEELQSASNRALHLGSSSANQRLHKLI